MERLVGTEACVYANIFLFEYSKYSYPFKALHRNAPYVYVCYAFSNIFL